MGAQGICFAVASNTAQFVLSELIKHGRVRRGYIGVSAQTTAVPRRHARAAEIDNASGAMITAIEPNGPAALAGLMTLDSIVRVDGAPVTGVDDLIRLLNGERIGRSVTIDILRRGSLRTFELMPRSGPRRGQHESQYWQALKALQHSLRQSPRRDTGVPSPDAEI